jgi:hypothetical protein
MPIDCLTLLRVLCWRPNRRMRRKGVVTALLMSTFVSGCAWPSHYQARKTIGNDTCEVDRISSEIDNPSPPIFQEVSHSAAPITTACSTPPFCGIWEV